MKIAIVGLGLLGGSLSANLKLNSEHEIFGFTGRESTKKDALKSGYFVEIYDYSDLSKRAKDFDIIFLCSPIEVIKEHIKEIAKCEKTNSKLVVTDIGSTKGEISKLAKECFKDRGNEIVFVGGHPMTGSEFSGFKASDAHIFENTIYLLTPDEETPKEATEKLIEIIKIYGANPTIINPDEHDKVVALISHFPQIVATLMTQMVSEDDFVLKAKKLCAGGFRDMTRIASSSYDIWKSIFKSNNEVIKKVIDNFINRLENIKELLGSEELYSTFETAANFRDEIPKDMRGFLSPIWELVVQVPDKAGVLAEITSILSENNINLKDFSVMKIREAISGSIKLGFESLEDRAKASELIEEKGYKSTKI